MRGSAVLLATWLSTHAALAQSLVPPLPDPVDFVPDEPARRRSAAVAQRRSTPPPCFRSCAWDPSVATGRAYFHHLLSFDVICTILDHL